MIDRIKIKSVTLDTSDDYFGYNWSRLEKLVEFGHLLKPCIQVSIDNNHVETRQAEVEFRKIDEIPKNMAFIESLSNLMNDLKSKNLVHGDIKYSNLGIDLRGNALVFDWEPCIMFTINNRIIFRSSANSLHPLDKKEKTISFRSDQFGFANQVLNAYFGRALGSNLAYKNQEKIEKVTSSNIQYEEITQFVLQLNNH